MNAFADAVQFLVEYEDIHPRPSNQPLYKRCFSESIEQRVLGDLIRREAGGEGIEGKLCVAWVVMCRVHSTREWWGTTPITVALCEKQFSCYDHVTGTTPSAVSVDAFLRGLSADRQCNLAAEGALNDWGRFDQPYTHYHALNVLPAWATAPGMSFIREVGGHRFYRET